MVPLREYASTDGVAREKKTVSKEATTRGRVHDKTCDIGGAASEGLAV
jgi:hypothetical protein